MSSKSTDIVDEILEIVFTHHTGGNILAFQPQLTVMKEDFTSEVNLASQIKPPEVRIEDIDATGVEEYSMKTPEKGSETLLTPTLEESIDDCSGRSPTLQSLVPGYVSSLAQFWAERCKAKEADWRDTLRELNPSWTCNDGDELTQLRETVIVQGQLIKELQGENMRLMEENERCVQLIKDKQVEIDSMEKLREEVVGQESCAHNDNNLKDEDSTSNNEVKKLKLMPTRGDRDAMILENVRLRQDLVEITKQWEVAEMKVSDLTSKLERFENIIQFLKSHTVPTENLVELRDENDILKDENDRYLSQVREVKGKVEILEKSLAELKSLVAICKCAKLDLIGDSEPLVVKIESNTSSKSSDLDMLIEENAKLKQEVVDLKKTNDDAQARVDELSNNLCNYEQVIEALKTQIVPVENIKEKMKSLDEDVAVLRRRLRSNSSSASTCCSSEESEGKKLFRTSTRKKRWIVPESVNVGDIVTPSRMIKMVDLSSSTNGSNEPSSSESDSNVKVESDSISRFGKHFPALTMSKKQECKQQ